MAEIDYWILMAKCIYEGCMLQDTKTWIFIHEDTVYIYVLIYAMVPRAACSSTR